MQRALLSACMYETKQNTEVQLLLPLKQIVVAICSSCMFRLEAYSLQLYIKIPIVKLQHYKLNCNISTDTSLAAYFCKYVIQQSNFSLYCIHFNTLTRCLILSTQTAVP